MISVLDRYIFKEWLKAFIISLAVMLGLLTLGQLYAVLPKLINFGIGFKQLAEYLYYNTPGYALDLLPLVFLVSILFAIGTLHKNNEIIVMKAAGISLMRISRPITIVGVFLSVIMLVLNASVVPHCLDKAQYLYKMLRSGYKSSVNEVWQTDIGFNDTKNKRLWFISRLAQKSMQASGINIYQSNEYGKALKQILAQKGYFDTQAGNWKLFKGREIIFDAYKNEPITSMPFEEKMFVELAESPDLIFLLNEEPAELSIKDLDSVLNYFSNHKNARTKPYRIRYQQILASSWSCLIVVAIALPLAASGIRVNPMINIAKASLLYAAYFGLVNAFYLASYYTMLPPWIAAWAPYGVALVAGMCFSSTHVKRKNS